ncbi:MAG: ribosome recycling factor [Gammaproteobacteria bacterium]|nr:MAG: ribosome recycling factor [Gammaproteobacteria bacterium]
MDIETIKQHAEERMKKSIEALRHELARLRTGRASTTLLDHIKVHAYGSEMPLNQVANVAVGDARTLVVTPWDKNLIQAVEKALRESDLGLNPVTAGNVIRIPLPPLTEERRRELVKVVKSEAEGAKVAIRNIRRDANAELKRLLKEKAITEDEERRAEEAIQKLTDRYIKQVDAILEEKEKELLTL